LTGANGNTANRHAAIIVPKRFVIAVARPALLAALKTAACGQDADNPFAGQASLQSEPAGFR
jgi:hypothetical protein